MKIRTESLRRKVGLALSTIGLGIALFVAPVAPASAAGILPTATTVQASASPVLVGSPVTLTAQVSVLGLGGLLVTPTGNVSFSAANGGPPIALGSAPLSPTCLVLSPCLATLTTSALTVGTSTITAAYAGDLLGAASAGTTAVVVNASVPCAPSATPVSQVGSVELTWSSGCDGGSPITSHRLYRSDTVGGTYNLIATDLPTGRYQDTTGIVGTTYYYKATTVNAVGESPQSSAVSVASTSFGGPGTFSTTACTGMACTAPVVQGIGTSGYATSIEATTTTSAGPHTLTTAIGGPGLSSGCAIMPVGLPATFNDTSTDAHKTITWTARGTDADANYQPVTDGYEGCLGLGTPWYAGSLANPAVWVPADGLYVAEPPLCVNNGAFALGGGLYSQPCTNLTSLLVGPVANHYYEIEYQLPPGDGRLGGGS